MKKSYRVAGSVQNLITFAKVICKKLSKTAPVKIVDRMNDFKNNLRKRFHEKLENSDGQIRIEILLHRDKSVVEKLWLDFKKIRYTKNRLYKM